MLGESEQTRKPWKVLRISFPCTMSTWLIQGVNREPKGSCALHCVSLSWTQLHIYSTHVYKHLPRSGVQVAPAKGHATGQDNTSGAEILFSKDAIWRNTFFFPSLNFLRRNEKHRIWFWLVIVFLISYLWQMEVWSDFNLHNCVTSDVFSPSTSIIYPFLVLTYIFMLFCSKWWSWSFVGPVALGIKIPLQKRRLHLF